MLVRDWNQVKINCTDGRRTSQIWYEMAEVWLMIRGAYMMQKYTGRSSGCCHGNSTLAHSVWTPTLKLVLRCLALKHFLPTIPLPSPPDLAASFLPPLPRHHQNCCQKMRDNHLFWLGKLFPPVQKMASVENRRGQLIIQLIRSSLIGFGAFTGALGFSLPFPASPTSAGHSLSPFVMRGWSLVKNLQYAYTGHV